MSHDVWRRGQGRFLHDYIRQLKIMSLPSLTPPPTLLWLVVVVIVSLSPPHVLRSPDYTTPQQGGRGTSDLVPPSRRKRRSKYNSWRSSKDFVFTVDIPSSPEEALMSTAPHDQGGGVCGGGDARPSSPGGNHSHL